MGVMSERDFHRIEVLAHVDDGRLSVQNGANLLGVTRRQMFRLLKTYRTEGGAVSRRLHRIVRHSLIWKVVAQIVVCSGVWIRSRGKRKPPLTRWCLHKAEREHQSFALQKERYFLPFIEVRNLDLLQDKRCIFSAWQNEFRPKPFGGYSVSAFAGWVNSHFDGRRNMRHIIFILLN